MTRDKYILIMNTRYEFNGWKQNHDIDISQPPSYLSVHHNPMQLIHSYKWNYS